MQLYAQNELVRSKQIVGDAAVAAWVVGSVLVGRFLNGLIHRLEAPGRFLEDAGASFSRTVGGAGDVVTDLPVIGDRLRAPFEAVVDGGESVGRAGIVQQDAVDALAFWLPAVIVALPILYVLARYLPGRLRWVREASAATSLLCASPDARLFALRALATRPLTELRRVSADPLGTYEAGDVTALAALELGHLGLEPPWHRQRA